MQSRITILTLAVVATVATAGGLPTVTSVEAFRDLRERDEISASAKQLAVEARQKQTPESLATLREARTKLELLKLPIPQELEDVEPYEIKVVQVEVVRADIVDVTGIKPPKINVLPLDVAKLICTSVDVDKLFLQTVDIAKLESAGITIKQLESAGIDVKRLGVRGVEIAKLIKAGIDVSKLTALGIIVPGVVIVKATPETVEISIVEVQTIIDGVRMWEARYNKIIDLRDEQGRLIVPMRGTVLWDMREKIKARVEQGGDYDTLWDEYYDSLRTAIERRKRLIDD